MIYFRIWTILRNHRGNFTDGFPRQSSHFFPFYTCAEAIHWLSTLFFRESSNWLPTRDKRKLEASNSENSFVPLSTMQIWALVWGPHQETVSRNYHQQMKKMMMMILKRILHHARPRILAPLHTPK